MDKPHWILRVMDQVTDPSWWDGLIVGFAVACIPFFVWLWWTQ